MGITDGWKTVGTIFPGCMMHRAMDKTRYTLQIVDCLGILNELKFGVGHESVRAIAVAIFRRIMFPFTVGTGDAAWGDEVEAGTPVGLILLFDDQRFVSRGKEATQKERSTKAVSTKAPRAPPAPFRAEQTIDDPLGNWGPNWYDKRENRPALQLLLRQALVDEFATAASLGWAPSLEMIIVDGSGRAPVSVRWSRRMNVSGTRVSAPLGADGRGVLPADVTVAASVETAGVEVDTNFEPLKTDIGESDYKFCHALRRWCELRVRRPGTTVRVLLRARDTDWTVASLAMLGIASDGTFLAGCPARTRIVIHQACDVLNAGYDPSTATRVMDVTQAFVMACRAMPEAAPGLDIAPGTSAVTCAWFLKSGGDDYCDRLRVPPVPGVAAKRLPTCGTAKDQWGNYLSWLRKASSVYLHNAAAAFRRMHPDVPAASADAMNAVKAAARKHVEVVRLIRRAPLETGRKLPGGRLPHAKWSVVHRPSVLANVLAGTHTSKGVTESYVSARAVTQMHKVGTATLKVLAGSVAPDDVHGSGAVETWARNLNFSITHLLHSMFDGLEQDGELRTAASPDCLAVDDSGMPTYGFFEHTVTRIVVSGMRRLEVGPGSGPRGSPEKRVVVGRGVFAKPKPKPVVAPTPPPMKRAKQPVSVERPAVRARPAIGKRKNKPAGRAPQAKRVVSRFFKPALDLAPT